MAEQKYSLLTKLDEIEARYSEIEKQLAEPLFVNDSTKLVALSKEQGKLKAIVTKYREYKKAVADMEQAEQILSDDSADEDLKTLAKEEVQQL
jgi:peptide chain release factor 1